MRSLDKNPKTETLLSFIVDVARKLDILPLAEGVETESNFEFLKKIGCEKAQGYLFGKPMPMDENREHTRGNGLEFEEC